MRRFPGIFIFLFLGIIGIAAAQPASYKITIQTVELKTPAGEWLTIIDPDKQVDVAQEEPGLSFFNNGRVPPGEYSNFRLNLQTPDGPKKLSAASDLAKPLVIGKGSFVSVWFTLDWAEDAKVAGLNLTVDQDERALGAGDVQVAA